MGFFVFFMSCDIACMDPQCERLPVLVFEIFEKDRPITKANFESGDITFVGIKDDNLMQDFYFFPIDQEKGYYSIEPSIQFNRYAIFYNQLFQDTLTFSYDLIETECCEFSPIIGEYSYKSESIAHHLGGIISISLDSD